MVVVVQVVFQKNNTFFKVPEKKVVEFKPRYLKSDNIFRSPIFKQRVSINIILNELFKLFVNSKDC